MSNIILAADMQRHNAIKLEAKRKAEIAAAREYAEGVVKRIYQKLPVAEPVLLALCLTIKEDADIVITCLQEWGYRVSDGRIINQTKHIFVDVANPLDMDEKYQVKTATIRAQEMKRLNTEKLVERAKAQEISALKTAEKMVQDLYRRLPIPSGEPQTFWFNPTETSYTMIAQHLQNWGYIVAESDRGQVSISLPPSSNS